MNCLIVAALIGFGSQSEPTITYTCPGKNAKAVFEELSKQAGQTLLIGQSLADEPIILRLDKAPLAKTMDRLAYALNGEWKEEKEGKRLVAKKLPADATPYNARLRTIMAMQRVAREEFANATQFDAKAAADYARELEEHLNRVGAFSKDDTAHLIAGYKLADRSLKATVGLRVFALLDPKQLAEIGQNERIVWSSHPTAKQRQLPASVTQLANQYFVESQIWGRELLNRPALIDKLQGADWTLMDLVPTSLRGRGGTFLSSTLPTKVNVIARSGGQTVNSIVFNFLDSKGEVLLSSSTNLSRNGTPPPQTVPDPILRPIDKPIVLDDLAGEYCRLTNERFQRGAGNQSTEVSIGLINVLLNPESSDPLSIAAGPTLIQYAQHKDEQLVAVLTDSVITGVQTNSERVADQNRFMRFFWQIRREHQVEESSGWMTIGIDSVFEAEGSRFPRRMPRKPLGNLLRQVRKDGYVSIESAGSFLSQLGVNPNLFSLSSVANSLGLQGISGEILTDQRSQSALRLVSSLSPLQRVAIKNGNVFEFASLSEEQRAILRYELYIKATIVLQAKGEDSVQSDGEIAFHFPESTELFLPDINPKAKFSVSSSESTMIHIGAHDWNDSSRPERNYRLDLADCGESLVALESRGTTLRSFRVVNSRSVTVRLQLDDNSHLEFAATEEQRKTPVVDSIDKLPPEIAKRIREDMEKFKPATRMGAC